MKKENELETNHIENGSFELDQSDIGTFLGKIARNLIKEGTSLEALANKWIDEGEIQTSFKEIGIDLSIWGDKLLFLRNQLCQKCMMRSVSVTIHFFNDAIPKEKEFDKK